MHHPAGKPGRVDGTGDHEPHALVERDVVLHPGLQERRKPGRRGGLDARVRDRGTQAPTLVLRRGGEHPQIPVRRRGMMRRNGCVPRVATRDLVGRELGRGLIPTTFLPLGRRGARGRPECRGLAGVGHPDPVDREPNIEEEAEEGGGPRRVRRVIREEPTHDRILGECVRDHRERPGPIRFRRPAHTRHPPTLPAAAHSKAHRSTRVQRLWSRDPQGTPASGLHELGAAGHGDLAREEVCGKRRFRGPRCEVSATRGGEAAVSRRGPVRVRAAVRSQVARRRVARSRRLRHPALETRGRRSWGRGSPASSP